MNLKLSVNENSHQSNPLHKFELGIATVTTCDNDSEILAGFAANSLDLIRSGCSGQRLYNSAMYNMYHLMFELHLNWPDGDWEEIGPFDNSIQIYYSIIS